MNTTNLTLFTFFLIFLIGCQEQPVTNAVDENPNLNPPAQGFDVVGSDVEAIALADSVMAAMGGRKAWDETRYIKWTFFGRRTLWWDKHQDRVRIHIPDDNTTTVVDLKSMEGQVKIGNQVLGMKDSIGTYLEDARKMWINDSYWLVMPFKLKDSGVTLKYLGDVMTKDSTQAKGLALTFTDVGVTPANKYHIAVDPETNLVSEWSFYSTSADEEPRFVMPWQDYQKHGQIMLSGDRGQHFLTDIEVSNQMDEGLFTGF